ncbi:PDZK1-interacting protein 1 [Microcaecilia unicolor]|uniref:PDZK1-interacting protein 1 n=1 Tax=Microcaecilia unicolor TaxID=1415580 RepID=A0A6P7Y771_9AMPH|nr:PDZK1-interacting protein 1 [Microcaecilia unicolor]
MFTIPLYLLCVLITLGSISCQQENVPIQRRFPQWLTGLIAVSVFLFLVLVVFVVNRVWCEDKKKNEPIAVNKKDEVISNGTEGHYAGIDNFRSPDHDNAYENRIEWEEQVVQTTAM